MTVLQHLNTKIDSGSFIEVEKITPALIKEAISKLKNDKTDPLYHFNSDWQSAQNVIDSGHISSIIMVSTVIPLIKNKLGDI